MVDPTNASFPDSDATGSKGKGLGKFFQTYHTFVSSFVIGIAGLIGTWIWQYRQAAIAEKQANTQQVVAYTEAENKWRIEKASILAKNFEVLTLPGKVEQRYGALLSLSRGKILDPELTIAYALDLGKESPEYMRSVLKNTENKDYWRLAHVFEPTCWQRYGVTKKIEICDPDKLATRSDAIAELIADEIQANPASDKLAPPMVLLNDERQTQAHATRLAWLFTPALLHMYERRQWKEISQFEGASSGAHLVAALVLGGSRNTDQRLISAQEKQLLEKFHQEHSTWLGDYIFENNCDGECKANLVDFMLTAYEESEGEYDETMKKLLKRPRHEVGRARSRLHSRLLWCQVDKGDLLRLRDKILVPALWEMFQSSNASLETSETLEDLVELIAVVDAPDEGDELKRWTTLIGIIEKSGQPGSAPANKTYASMLAEKRKKALDDRTSPRSETAKKMSFCPRKVAPSPGTMSSG
jgi:hypothetical protein